MARLTEQSMAGVRQILTAVLPALSRPPALQADATEFSRYRATIDRLLSDTRAAARSDTLIADLASIVRGYRVAAGDMEQVFNGLDRVISVVRAFEPGAASTSVLERSQRDSKILLAGYIEWLCCAEMARAVADLTLTSHEQARRLRLAARRTFDVAIERAADNGDVAVAAALRAVLGSISRDLIERGLPLARIVAYRTGTPLPAVTLAHLLYQDAGRAAELMAENTSPHPAFMPVAGRAYSR